MSDLFIDRDASISDCGKYRWTLSRAWVSGMRRPWVAWVMLNPSTADGNEDDATIRKCMNFSRDLGFGGMTVQNLFPFRATNREVLKGAEDPIGPNPDHLLLDLWSLCPMVIAAWGVDGGHRGRDRQVYELIRKRGFEFMCLGITKDGHPRHPLYLPASTRPVKFEMPQQAENAAPSDS